jgi:hypothetical protein
MFVDLAHKRDHYFLRTWRPDPCYGSEAATMKAWAKRCGKDFL